MRIPRALTIAGSEWGGGGGIQADLKTFSAFRVFGMSVITAVTAQNSVGVQGVENLPPAFVVQQLRSVLSDFGADAAKCGMLSTAPIIEAVADVLAEHPIRRQALISRILPLALVVTPNLPEAEALSGISVRGREGMEEAARRIHALGPRHVLVKGGHLEGDALDLLWDGRDFTELSVPRVDSPNTHGTGCTFSAAIAAGLALGQSLLEAVRRAKAYVTRAIQEGFQAGRGGGQLRHFLTDW